jgi:hypothetical protein
MCDKLIVFVVRFSFKLKDKLNRCSLVLLRPHTIYTRNNIRNSLKICDKTSQHCVFE